MMNFFNTQEPMVWTLIVLGLRLLVILIPIFATAWAERRKIPPPKRRKKR